MNWLVIVYGLGLLHCLGWIINYFGFLVAVKAEGKHSSISKLIWVMILGFFFTFFWEFIYLYDFMER